MNGKIMNHLYIHEMTIFSTQIWIMAGVRLVAGCIRAGFGAGVRLFTGWMRAGVR